MAAESLETGILDVGGDEDVSPAVSALEQEALIENGGVSFRRTPGGLHAIVNHASKWIVAVTFGGLLLLRHDSLALWAAMGSVINMTLSVTLKKILKQERPVSRVNSVTACHLPMLNPSFTPLYLLSFQRSNGKDSVELRLSLACLLWRLALISHGYECHNVITLQSKSSWVQSWGLLLQSYGFGHGKQLFVKHMTPVCWFKSVFLLELQVSL